jgi:hypothetical protein
MESRAQVIQVLAVCLTQETKNHKGANMTEEDEAFNEIERQAQQRKEAVKATVSLNPYRSQVIEEVAQAILKMEGFGRDTLNSFAIYIRGLK